MTCAASIVSSPTGQLLLYLVHPVSTFVGPSIVAQRPSLSVTAASCAGQRSTYRPSKLRCRRWACRASASVPARRAAYSRSFRCPQIVTNFDPSFAKEASFRPPITHKHRPLRSLRIAFGPKGSQKKLLTLCVSGHGCHQVPDRGHWKFRIPPRLPAWPRQVDTPRPPSRTSCVPTPSPIKTTGMLRSTYLPPELRGSPCCSELLNNLVYVEGIVTKCTLVRPKVRLAHCPAFLAISPRTVGTMAGPGRVGPGGVMGLDRRSPTLLGRWSRVFIGAQRRRRVCRGSTEI